MENSEHTPQSTARIYSLYLTIIAISIVLALCLAEVVLRTFPVLISVPVLERFNSDLRHAVADRLKLSTKSSRRIIPSSERSDRGPDFYIFEPSRTLVVPADTEDLSRGAIDEVKVDRNGFCNPPVAAERSTVDVLLLGDSFTFCTAVSPEDTSSAQLERITGFHVYNLGIPGIGPFEYVELLRKFGLGRKPRVVVMNIYEGNDLRDSDLYNNFLVLGKQSMDQDATGGLFAWSYALAFIKAAIEQEVKELRRNTGLDFRYTVTTPSGSILMNFTNQDRDEVVNALRVMKGNLLPSIIEPALRSFHQLARQHGFVPVIVLIPSAYTAYAGSVVFDDQVVGQAVRGASEAQRLWLKTYAAKEGMLFLDLAATFQEATQKGSLTHFPGNVHLTPEGQRIVAIAIANVLHF